MSSRAAVPLLVAAGVLLLAVAVVPSLLSKKETATTTTEEEPAAWQPEEAERWSDEASVWSGPSDAAASAKAGDEYNVPALPGEADGTSGARLSPAVAARPQSVPLQASSPQGPAIGAAPPDAEITSWRDPGQWPYGNGVGVPDRATSFPAGYPGTAEQTASYELPPGVRGTPIPYLSPDEGSQLPRAGTNRAMALGSPTSTAAAYSADARSAGWPQQGASYPDFRSRDAGDWTAPQDPGVRLQGVIRKPSVGTTYEYDRPGVY